MSETHTVRPGEVLIVSDRKRLVTTKFDEDQFGRMKPFGIEADTPTIVGAAEGAAAAERVTGVELVRGEQGVLPARFGAGSEDQALRNAFEGRVHEPSLKEKTNALMENEGIRPSSLADSVLRLIEDAGVGTLRGNRVGTPAEADRDHGRARERRALGARSNEAHRRQSARTVLKEDDMTLKKTQDKRGHLRGEQPNKTAKTGRAEPKGQPKRGATRNDVPAPATGVRDGGLIDNASTGTARTTSVPVTREDDGVR